MPSGLVVYALPLGLYGTFRTLAMLGDPDTLATLVGGLIMAFFFGGFLVFRR